MLDLKYGQGITEDNAKVFTREIATVLSKDTSLRVQTSEDTRITMDVEAQKQILGCDGEDSCLAEIASALGTDTLLVGRLDRIGADFTLQLTLLDANNARPKVRTSARDKSVSALIARIDALLGDTQKELNPDFNASWGISASPLLIGGMVGAGVGTLAVLGGLSVGGFAFAQMTNTEVAKEVRETNRSMLFWPSLAGVAVGLAAIAGGAAVAAVGLAE